MPRARLRAMGQLEVRHSWSKRLDVSPYREVGGRTLALVPGDRQMEAASEEVRRLTGTTPVRFLNDAEPTAA